MNHIFGAIFLFSRFHFSVLFCSFLFVVVFQCVEGRSGAFRNIMGDRGYGGGDFENAPSASSNNNRVYVGNLSWKTSWQNLKDHMRTCGAVVHADVILDADHRSKGCGVVEFATAAEAQKAIVELTDTELDGRRIWVREDRDAKPRRAPRGDRDDYFSRSSSRPSYGSGGGSRGAGRSYSGGSGTPSPHVYVGNLAYSVNSDMLHGMFSKFGKVVEAQVKTYPDGSSKGFGLVSFESQSEAEAAVRDMDGQTAEGRQLRVHYDRDM